ncbi:hypothetical protein WJX73_009009 [Symbiochloris irregularis]|uniref:F-box domain-containing protein n=1 Tax=Symbiochloris irregularis TaxID=706552 RepID=A0AAW1PKS0_9CHLO
MDAHGQKVSELMTLLELPDDMLVQCLAATGSVQAIAMAARSCIALRALHIRALVCLPTYHITCSRSRPYDTIEGAEELCDTLVKCSNLQVRASLNSF